MVGHGTKCMARQGTETTSVKNGSRDKGSVLDKDQAMKAKTFEGKNKNKVGQSNSLVHKKKN